MNEENRNKANEIIRRAASTEVSNLFTDDDIDALVSGIDALYASTPSIGGKPILRLSRMGEWIYGQGDDPVQPGSEWMINPKSIMWGWVCWSDDRKLVGETMVPIYRPLPEIPAPIGGLEWKASRTFDLKCVYGDDAGLEVVFKTNAKGGVNAVNQLFMDKVKPRILSQKVLEPAKRTPVPVVELAAGSYPNKQYGGHTFYPVFKINDWATMTGETNTPAEASAGAVQDGPHLQTAMGTSPSKPMPEPVAAARPSAPPRRQRPQDRA